MTPQQVETIAASDNATLLLFNSLIRFLELNALLKRDQLVDYLRMTADTLEAEGADQTLLQFFRSRIGTIAAERISAHRLN